MSSDKIDISVKEVDYTKRQKFNGSSLTLNFKGKDLNCKIVNTLRRVACNNIPVYAFPRELIDIQQNTCVAFNNDMLRLRLSQLPLLSIDENELYFLQEKYYKDINFADPSRPKHPSEKSIEAYVNFHNNSNAIKDVTTNDMKIYIDGAEVKMYDKDYPYLLVRLRPNDSFKCHMKACLGIGEYDAIWNASSDAFYDQLDEKQNEYAFTVESNGQLAEYDILIKSCKFIVKKMEDVEIEINRKLQTKELSDGKKFRLTLDEDHTVGEILNYYIQNLTDTNFSGVSKPDHLIKNIKIKIVSKKTTIPVIKTAIADIISIYKHLEKQFTKLQGKKN
uniref:DNA-directed RNA polymerase RpoA/D/Rpb3-type domain-containing protein n=1 Tax=viral metagenome TaxID=1070528 RepID=A0A6C0EBM2_9ZZZZ